MQVDPAIPPFIEKLEDLAGSSLNSKGISKLNNKDFKILRLLCKACSNEEKDKKKLMDYIISISRNPGSGWGST